MLLVYLRTILLYLFLILAVRIMGKRQVGEMEPAEFVVTMLVANLAAIPMQDGGIPLFSGLIPIFTVLAVDLAVTAAGVLRLRARMDELRYVEAMLQDLSEVIGEGLSDGVLLARETLTIEKAGQLKDKMLLKAMEKRDELEAMRQELMGRVPAIHRRIFQAFPSLQNGSYRHIIETIREHWGGSH